MVEDWGMLVIVLFDLRYALGLAFWGTLALL